MSAAIEREIRQLLSTHGSAEFVIDELIGRWRRNLLSSDEVRTVAQFMLNGGFEQKLLLEITRLLEEHQAVPWAHFAATLDLARITPTEAELRAIIEGISEQHAWDEVVDCPATLAWDPIFAEKFKEKDARKALALAEKMLGLKEKLQFFRNNRMVSEEGAVLEELRALFPEDPQFQLDERDLQERWAREVISNRSAVRTDVTMELNERLNRLTPDQLSIKDIIVRQCLAMAEEKPHAAYDLALLLIFMEFYIEAIELLNVAPRAANVDWLRLEILLKARQYVTVLDEANRLEIKYAGDPESSFTVVYARARALWGLGQSAIAIDLMRSIVSVRPNYKSAMSLLADWNGEDWGGGEF